MSNNLDNLNNLAINGNLDQYKSDNLFLLVGTNPLPNYIAGKILAHESTHFYFVHTEETNEIADRIIQVLCIPSNKWTKINVNPADTRDIYSNIKKEAEGKDSLGLHYTSGKKSMSVHAYRAIYDANSSMSVFSYLDSRTLEMLIDRKNDVLVKFPVRYSVNISIEDLLALHGYTPKEYTKEPNHPEVARSMIELNPKEHRNWCTNNLRKENNKDKLKKENKLSQVSLEEFKKSAALGSHFKELDSLGQLAELWGETSKDVAKWLDGLWLEDYVFSVVQDLADKNGIHTCIMNLVPNERNFEIDILALKGYQLIILSCTTAMNKSILKEKLFEAFIRGNQLGGDEAKIGLVCCAENGSKQAPDIIKMELEEEWNSKGKFGVFGLDHLPNLEYHLQDWIESFE
ncbi:Card1-like endonuclease domain-containing protein [Methanosalsum natronophilum]|uniref:Card1-like endonuclease domain-containing protein n=1 Tax=Methanosalsum natronophilum TaxID=768733 RepID=UPI00216A1A73|nr:DUF1887 family CARF protein [Methanosalsum natronophilum]MCS3924846.1 hypothetical protein [Methanosalsum natronophilum]